MIDFKNKEYTGFDGRKSLFDCRIPEGSGAVVLFIHGYKGFKDWGAWNLVEEKMIQSKIGFVKFNLSHNGGTVDDPIDFPDLEAFGRNTYSAELFDLKVVAEEVQRMLEFELELKVPLYLVGHSRGGGVAVLGGSRMDFVAGVVSWAGISNIGSRFPVDEELEEWKRQGVRFVMNGRTGQQMPHYYSFYEDFEQNKELLNIENAARSLSVPFLQIHGDMDEAVSISEGSELARWTETRLKIIKGAEHTFGASHPWNNEVLPEELAEVVDATIEFINTPTS